MKQPVLPEFPVDWGALEALLFATAEPLSAETLGRILQVPPAAAEEALSQWWQERQKGPCGVELQRVAEGYRLVTRPQYAPLVRQIKTLPDRSGLSAAALEVLAIIAYRQPITRAEIDQLRGVHSDSALHSLLERGLIEEKGRSNAIGRPVLYGTTQRFLVELGLDSLSQLPQPEQQEAAATATAQAQTTAGRLADMMAASRPGRRGERAAR
ncbi:MAG: SMC-Scp complex subunit ScpB [Limnochordaceae bacterium]|nr:SMC-Scp complex subunit ScpB [Limnochordaceae bacterium]